MKVRMVPCLWTYWLCCTSVVTSPRDSLQSPLSPNLCMSAGLGGEPVTPHYKNKEVWLSWRGTPAALMSLLVCAAIHRGGNGP